MSPLPQPLPRSGVIAALTLALLTVPMASQTTAQPSTAPDQQPPVERPLNPTQEVAGATPQGPSLAIGPAQLRVGGYLGLTAFVRSTNGGGGIGTNFASIPYEDTLQGNVSETRLSAQASRITLRVDADFPEQKPRFRKLAGYFEMDFNGAVPGSIAITSTSAGFRLRHAFAEVQYGAGFSLAAGQAFSLMTPQKREISMWPSDVEMSQAVDTNYLAGMLWGRIPQLRLTWRPSTTFNWAVSLENPEQTLGRAIVALPRCCASEIDAQYNTGDEGLSVPNLMPDVITRVAFNPTSAVHLDVGGVLRAFRHRLAPYQDDDSFTTFGGGTNINGSVGVTPNTKVLGQFAIGAGIGRYIGGLVPDVTFTADSSIDPLDTSAWVGGVEQKFGPWISAAAYYSGVRIDHQTATDTDGTFIGFGFPGSPHSNNKSIRELTFTGSFAAFRSTDRGSAQISLQYSWLEREPWDASTRPSSASMQMFFAQIRYNLP